MFSESVTKASKGEPLKVRTKVKQGVVPGSLTAAPIYVDQADAGSSAGSGTASTAPDSGIQEYYPPIKMTLARQAAIDMALFQLVICAALPFAFLGNPWLIM
ncbi:hypothetical protein B0H19DRAFT_1274579 [Mycena capillaripes]|nr:hypothetical protein B0H19DRAFT_1274579 [Mycena capillaripes]